MKNFCSSPVPDSANSDDVPTFESIKNRGRSFGHVLARTPKQILKVNFNRKPLDCCGGKIRQDWAAIQRSGTRRGMLEVYSATKQKLIEGTIAIALSAAVDGFLPVSAVQETVKLAHEEPFDVLKLLPTNPAPMSWPGKRAELPSVAFAKLHGA